MNSQGKITAILEFNKEGRLKAVYLNAESTKDQDVLERSLDRLIKPSYLGWLKGLFKSK
jgi:hypothetical protein